YFTTGQQPRRSQTQHDVSTSSRAPRSPHRGVTSNALLGPYIPQQNQYSSSTPISYPYSPSLEQRGAYMPGTYQAHSRSHSQSKGEAMTPPVPAASAYSSQNVLQTSNVY
ncbi:hypothetical protein BKA93DRAFT_712685, partial [Sparassis latifolia]